jgi:hypothetical protein
MDEQPEKFRIYCDKSSANVRKIIRFMGRKRLKHPDNADLIWVRHRFASFYDKLTPYQCFNHLPAEGSLANKGTLYAHLNAHAKEHPERDFTAKDFLQPSYRLYIPEERDAFLAQMPAADREENLWILKPCNLSKGVGIRVIWKLNDIKQQLIDNSGQLPVKKHGLQDYIIQKYIKNPLLLNGHKSEIRVYWLIASLDPLLVLMFNGGTTRLTTLKYSLGDYDNPLVHVTNAYQQKKHPEYDSLAVLKWSFKDLGIYFVESGYTDNENYIAEVLLPKCNAIIATVVEAMASTLKAKPGTGLCFGLYGADIIIDDNLTPWLAEVQRGPGLSHSDDVKKHVIPAMVAESINIMQEVRYKKLHNLSLTDLESARFFQWVVNEAR